MNVSIIIAVCYYIVLIAQFGIMWKAKNPGENEIFSITVPNEKLENEEIKGVQKKYMTMLGIFTVIFVAAPAVMFGTDNGTVQVLLWMILFLLLVVCSYLPYWVANARVKALKAEHHYMAGCSIPQIDEQWRHGIFYYNPGDTRLNGEKKIGVGTCINHAKPMGKFLSVLAWVLIALLLVFGVYLVRAQSLPLTLTYKDGVLKSGQTRTNYTIDVDTMQFIMFLDKLPSNSKVIGTDMDNLQRGIYNVEGFGECRMNVNPQNQAFILIQTEDGCYIFSADKDEKTSKVYQQLKDDL